MNWQIVIRKHRFADAPARKGLPTEVVDIVADGKIIATVAPVQEYGPGIQITANALDLTDPHILLVEGQKSVIFGPPGENARLRSSLFAAAGVSMPKEKRK